MGVILDSILRSVKIFTSMMQAWFNGRTPAFQAGNVGSIPIACFGKTPVNGLFTGVFFDCDTFVTLLRIK